MKRIWLFSMLAMFLLALFVSASFLDAQCQSDVLVIQNVQIENVPIVQKDLQLKSIILVQAEHQDMNMKSEIDVLTSIFYPVSHYEFMEIQCEKKYYVLSEYTIERNLYSEITYDLYDNIYVGMVKNGLYSYRHS